MLLKEIMYIHFTKHVCIVYNDSFFVEILSILVLKVIINIIIYSSKVENTVVGGKF